MVYSFFKRCPELSTYRSIHYFCFFCRVAASFNYTFKHGDIIYAENLTIVIESVDKWGNPKYMFITDEGAEVAYVVNDNTGRIDNSILTEAKYIWWDVKDALSDPLTYILPIVSSGASWVYSLFKPKPAISE